MTRYTQVKKLGTPQALRDHLAEIGVELPVDDTVDPHGALAQPITFTDGSTGEHTIANRFAVLPMEGWDGTTDGRPTALVRRRWGRFGDSGCGLVWAEATAVAPEGRANPHQLMINPDTVGGLAELRGLLAPTQVAGLQLTHSGRWARPEGALVPRTGQRHAELDRRVDADADALLTDDELDELAESFIVAAGLARDAGFDFVDVKCCHGYLLHELLSGRDRDGRYGGDEAGRTAFVRRVIGGIRERVPDIAVAVRLSIFDFLPHETGPDGTGVPVRAGQPPRPFRGGGVRPRHRPQRDAPLHRPAAQPRGWPGVCDRRQPVLQPARSAARLLPALRRLPASRGTAGRGGPPSPRHRRARPGTPGRHVHRIGLLLPPGLAGQRGSGGGGRRGRRHGWAWPHGGSRTPNSPPTCLPAGQPSAA